MRSHARPTCTPALVADRRAPAGTSAERATLELDAATVSILDDARRRRHRTVLDRSPVVVARSGGSGGTARLHRPGLDPLDAGRPPAANGLALAVVESRTALRELAAAALADPAGPSWWPAMAAYLDRHHTALAGLDAAEMAPEHRRLLHGALSRNAAFLEECLARHAVAPAALEDLLADDGATRCLEVAAAVQVEHWMTVLDRWRELLGAAWDDLLAITGSEPAARRTDLMFSVLAQLMGPAAVGDRLLLVEAAAADTTSEDLLDVLVVLVSDRAGAARLITDFVLLDIDALDGRAGRVLAEGARRRGLTPLAPALAPVVGRRRDGVAS